MNTFKVKKVLDKESKNNNKKIEDKFNVVSSKLSKAMNDDMTEYINQFLIKNDKSSVFKFDNIKKQVIQLIKVLYLKLNQSIYFNDEIIIGLSYKLHFIPDKIDIKLIYNILFLLYKYYPNKYFSINKYKFSKARNYFIYKVNYNNEIKYLIFDYNEINDERKIYIYPVDNLEELKETIKENFKVNNPITGSEHSVSYSKSKSSSSK